MNYVATLTIISQVLPQGGCTRGNYCARYLLGGWDGWASEKTVQNTGVREKISN